MKRIGIIGAGRFGAALTECLARRGAEVLLIDSNAAIIQRMSSIVPNAVQGDATDPDLLIRAGFQECDAAVVAIGARMECSILATTNLKDLKVPYVVAKATSDLHGKVLERIGADLVVYPNRERAQRLARSMVARSAMDNFEIAEGASVVEMHAPEQFIGKSLAEAGIRKAYGVTVLAIKRAPDETGKVHTIISPTTDDMINRGDSIVIFGPNLLLEAIS